MDRRVKIDGQERTLRANALLPRKYRHFFNRDLIADMKKLYDDYKATEGQSFDVEVFENLAWLMLREAGEQVGATPEEWLASVDDAMGLYLILPDVVELWAKNQTTTAIPKKK